MTNVYQLVTDRIIQELERGVIPWHKPWNSINGGAYNFISKHRYSTLNQLLLMHEGPYATIQQWNKIGGKVRKGEKSEFVTFWKFPEESDEDEYSEEGSEKKQQRPVLKLYRVFHISQVEGIELPEEKYKTQEIDVEEQAELVFKNYINKEHILIDSYPSDKAYYMPSEDLIHIPSMSQFNTKEGYYGTMYHEAVHSTGHLKRLNRAGLQMVAFGSEEYSKEELIAEIGSACMLRTLGLETDDSIRNNAAYVHGWLQALKNDKRLIAVAAGQAEKAVRFILERTEFEC